MNAKDAPYRHQSPSLHTFRPPHIFDQAATVQFSKKDDPVTPSTSVHVSCVGVVGLKGVDSKLPPCCWQVVLVSPLTGGDIWLILLHYRWRRRHTGQWGPWSRLQGRCYPNRLAVVSEMAFWTRRGRPSPPLHQKCRFINS